MELQYYILRNENLKFEWKKEDVDKTGCQAICIIAKVNRWLASSIGGNYGLE